MPQQLGIVLSVGQETTQAKSDTNSRVTLRVDDKGEKKTMRADM